MLIYKIYLANLTLALIVKSVKILSLKYFDGLIRKNSIIVELNMRNKKCIIEQKKHNS